MKLLNRCILAVLERICVPWPNLRERVNVRIFFEFLPEIPASWQREANGSIRAFYKGCKHCPLTLMAADCGLHAQSWIEAAKKLGFSHGTALRISAAADNHPDCDRTIRRKFMRLTGVIENL